MAGGNNHTIHLADSLVKASHYRNTEGVTQFLRCSSVVTVHTGDANIRVTAFGNITQEHICMGVFTA